MQLFPGVVSFLILCEHHASAYWPSRTITFHNGTNDMNAASEWHFSSLQRHWQVLSVASWHVVLLRCLESVASLRGHGFVRTIFVLQNQ
jgi:hypothetical protein